MWSKVLHMQESLEQRKRPTGRRAGDSGTRDAILDAARELFAERGYDGASIRAIAAAAGVDPALIRHFFGDKDTLFATTVADRTNIPERLAGCFTGDPAMLGARITDTYLRLWEDAELGPILMSLARSAVTSPQAAEMFIDVLGAKADNVMGHDSNIAQVHIRRVALAASHLFGVAMGRHVIKIPPLVDMPHEELVAELAPTIQRYFTEPPK